MLKKVNLEKVVHGFKFVANIYLQVVFSILCALVVIVAGEDGMVKINNNLKTIRNSILGLTGAGIFFGISIKLKDYIDYVVSYGVRYYIEDMWILWVAPILTVIVCIYCLVRVVKAYKTRFESDNQLLTHLLEFIGACILTFIGSIDYDSHICILIMAVYPILKIVCVRRLPLILDLNNATNNTSSEAVKVKEDQPVSVVDEFSINASSVNYKDVDQTILDVEKLIIDTEFELAMAKEGVAEVKEIVEDKSDSIKINPASNESSNVKKVENVGTTSTGGILGIFKNKHSDKTKTFERKVVTPKYSESVSDILKKAKF